MPISISGNDITMTGVDIEVVNGANDESGVAYIIITPSGGVGSLPFMAQGLPGQPTLFPSITAVQHPAGDTLPVPNPVVTLVDAGGAGLPSKYNLEFHYNQGITGLTGSPSIAGASDLAASPVLGVTTEKFMLIYRNSDGKWVPTALKVGDTYGPTAIANTSFANTPSRTLTQIPVPQQPFDWRPKVFAQTIVTGSVDTRVDLIARVNDPVTGDQVGYGKGLIGANAAGVQTVLIPGSPAGSAVPGAYGKVAAGVATTVFLRAENKGAASSSWSTPADPNTTFQVEVDPLP